MKKSKLLMTAPLAIAAATAPALATSCNLFNPQPTSTTLSSIMVSDASAIYCTRNYTSGSSTYQMYKINAAGVKSEVTGITAAGQSVSLQGRMFHKIDDTWMYLSLESPYNGDYLLNTKTNQCFKTENFHPYVNDDVPYDTGIQKDNAGNIYYAENNKIVKASLLNPAAITPVQCSLTGDSPYSNGRFAVSASGELIYEANAQGVDPGTIRYRGVDGLFRTGKLEGLENIWQGPDKKMYAGATSGSTSRIYSVAPSETKSGEIEFTLYKEFTDYSIASNPVWHINNCVLNLDYQKQTIYQLYNAAPFSPAMKDAVKSHQCACATSTKLYLGGNDRLDVYEPINNDLISYDQVGYQFNKIGVSTNGLLIFYGINNSTGAKSVCVYINEVIRPVDTLDSNTEIDSFIAL